MSMKLLRHRGAVRPSSSCHVTIRLAGVALVAVLALGVFAPCYGAESDEELFKSTKIKANAGDALAQFNLASMYANGKGIPKDRAESVKWCRKAAEQGYAEAQRILGTMYKYGSYVPKDDAEAVKWYRMAANQGVAEGQYLLGSMYSNGQGVPKDDAEAVKWYRKAAEQGIAGAQTQVGNAYKLGLGVPQDHTEAVKWYRKAADAGDATAMLELGGAYAYGQGVPKSESVGIDWIYKAGQTYLVNKERENALRCVDLIKLVQSNHPLSQQLLALIYADKGQAKPNPQTRGDAADLKITSSGTGWVCTEGYIVTNHHVIAGKSRLTLITADGTKLNASVAGQDAANDLVLLKVVDVSKLPPGLPLAGKQLKVGESLFTIGYPHTDLMGVRSKLTSGVVNATTGAGDDPRTLQMSAAVQAGNSGGPVFNMKGEVVAIAVAKLNAVQVFKWTGDLPENVAYAVKVGYLRPLIEAAAPIDFGKRVEPTKTDAALEDVAARVQASVVLVIAE